MISYRKKFNRQPYFRLKIPLYKGNIAIRIVDEDNNEIISDRLPSEEMIFSGILELKGIKFLKQEVLCDIELATIIIHNPKKKQNNITGLIKEKKKRGVKSSSDKSTNVEPSEVEKNTEQSDNMMDNNESNSKNSIVKENIVSEIRSNENGNNEIEDSDNRMEDRDNHMEDRDNHMEGRDNENIDNDENVSISYYKEDLNRDNPNNDNIDIKSIDNIIKEKRKIIDELESKKKYIEDQISQRENTEAISDSYSEIDRQEERRDKIIRRELIDRLRIERNKANTMFAEAQKVMEIYEEKRENALHQVAIVKELELELNNLE